MEGPPLPVYGDGLQVRDWLYVEDHCRGILAVLQKGREGEIYNIGGNCSLTNREVITRVLDAVGALATLIRTVADRPGHDRRYALRSDKVARDTGFSPSVPFETGLARTVQWYRDNADWTRRVRTGEYREYYEKNYGSREILQPSSR
jgi:dTDP-glucose 4,6-dehydratase